MCLLARYCLLTWVYWKVSMEGTRMFEWKKWDNMYKYRTYEDIGIVILIGVFYIFVFRMVLFWDTIYLQKVEQIYNQRHQFTDTERLEIEYSYEKIQKKIRMTIRFAKWFLLIYYLCELVFLIGDLNYLEDHNMKIMIAVTKVP